MSVWCQKFEIKESQKRQNKGMKDEKVTMLQNLVMPQNTAMSSYKNNHRFNNSYATGMNMKEMQLIFTNQNLLPFNGYNYNNNNMNNNNIQNNIQNNMQNNMMSSGQNMQQM